MEWTTKKIIIALAAFIVLFVGVVILPVSLRKGNQSRGSIAGTVPGVSSDTEADAANNVPLFNLQSDVPSLLPSDIPSSLPSDIPSTLPSDIPSSLPSDSPSALPSDAPSSSPDEAYAMVTGLILIDASEDKEIGPLVESATIDLDEVGSELTIVATVAGPVESVTFDFDDGLFFRTESTSPYSLGSNDGPNFFPATELGDLGNHIIVATPYTGDSATGMEGMSLTIEFTVIDSGLSPTQAPTPSMGSDYPSIIPISWTTSPPTSPDQMLMPTENRRHTRMVKAVRERTRRRKKSIIMKNNRSIPN